MYSTVQYCKEVYIKKRFDCTVVTGYSTAIRASLIMWMTLLEQRQQKAIDSLTDEQLEKLRVKVHNVVCEIIIYVAFFYYSLFYMCMIKYMAI